MGSTRPGRESSGKIPSFVIEDEEGTATDIRLGGTKPPPSVRDRPFLIILAGSNVGEMHAVKQSEMVIGRASKAAIRIEDDAVSRKHAKITVSDGNVHVEDMGSANGTHVNGNQVAGKQLLQDGDKITLGSTVILKFTYSDEIEASFQRKLLDGALRDGLTNAFNKRYLLDRLTTELAFAKRHKQPLTVIMLDVDHFKRINDSHGHPTGDLVLVALANAVMTTIRKEDVFARFGGEEFVVLCRSVDLANATRLAERLRESIGAVVVQHEGKPVPVTVSLGVAGFLENDADTPEKLIGLADEALYEAKQNGRNRVVARRTD